MRLFLSVSAFALITAVIFIPFVQGRSQPWLPNDFNIDSDTTPVLVFDPANSLESISGARTLSLLSSPRPHSEDHRSNQNDDEGSLSDHDNRNDVRSIKSISRQLRGLHRWKEEIEALKAEFSYSESLWGNWEDGTEPQQMATIDSADVTARKCSPQFQLKGSGLNVLRRILPDPVSFLRRASIAACKTLYGNDNQIPTVKHVTLIVEQKEGVAYTIGVAGNGAEIKTPE